MLNSTSHHSTMNPHWQTVLLAGADLCLGSLRHCTTIIAGMEDAAKALLSSIWGNSAKAPALQIVRLAGAGLCFPGWHAAL